MFQTSVYQLRINQIYFGLFVTFRIITIENVLMLSLLILCQTSALRTFETENLT